MLLQLMALERLMMVLVITVALRLEPSSFPPLSSFPLPFSFPPLASCVPFLVSFLPPCVSSPPLYDASFPLPCVSFPPF